MSTRKRKVLTLEDRVGVLQHSAKGETAIAIAKYLDVGKTQIQSIIRDKESILQRWKSGESGERKTVARKCTYGDLNQQVWEWFCDGRSRSVPVSGRMIQDKAVMLAKEAGYLNFAGSNGWLDRWCKRLCVKLSSDNCGVDQSVIEERGKMLVKFDNDICAKATCASQKEMEESYTSTIKRSKQTVIEDFFKTS